MAGAWLVASLPLHAAPFGGQAAIEVPARDSEVVEVLRERPLSAEERQWRAMRAQLRAQPRSLQLATDVAWQALRWARRDGDPRLLGQAEAALAPWWGLREPPPEVRLLRATLLQSTHDFDAALRDLQALVRMQPPPPQAPQAWLTLASVLQVTGRYDDAERACEGLRAAQAVWHAQACLLALQSLRGQPDAAQQGLLALSRQAPRELQDTVQLMRAELAERRGQTQQALALYQALLLQADDAYLLGACADLLLDLGRPAEVLSLLKDRERNDALLLRMAEAGMALHEPAARGLAQTQVAALKAKFEAAHLRGDSVHRREEARLALRLLHQPQRALQLARANWQVQKEPADARVLLEAALAAQDTATVASLRDDVQHWGWQDRRLEALW